MRIKKELGFLGLFLFLFIFFSGVSISHAAETGYTVTIKNAGFETTSPLDWTPFNTYSNGTISSLEKYSGSYSLKLSDVESNFPTGMYSSKVSITPGEKSLVSAYMKRSNDGNAGIYLRYYDQAGNFISQSQDTNSGAGFGTWEYVSVLGTAPANATYAQILLNTSSTTKMDVFFDNVTFKRIIENNSFEEGKTGWKQAFGGTTGISVSTTEKYSGNQALQIVDNSTTTGIGIESSDISVSPGEVISTSTMLKGNAFLYLRFYDEAGTLVTSVSSGGDTAGVWKKYSLSGSTPSTAKTARIMLYTPKDGSGTSYFDQVELYKTSNRVYTGILPSNQVQTYRFKTTKVGIVNFNLMEGNSVVDIVSVTDTKTYFDGDTLPIGEYQLVFSPRELDSTQYKGVLSGDLGISGDTVLPILDISSPKSIFTRLPKNVFTTVFSGSSNGAIINYTLNHNSRMSLTNSFSKTLNVLFGSNFINAYAESPSKNYVTDIREVVSPGVLRISGENRFETSVEVSKEIEKEGFDIKTVIITDAYSFADGLPGAVLGVKETAPILVSGSDGLHESVKAEITRLGAQKAIILGGTSVLSPNIEVELQNMGVTVERISGDNRYESAAKIAERVVDENSTSAIIVNGDTYVDGLLAASYAAYSQTPILYSQSDSLPTATKQFLNNHPNIDDIIIIGGDVSISSDVVTQLTTNYGNVFRVDGKDRFATSLNIPKTFNYNQRSFVLVSNEIDGVPSTVLAGIKQNQILLTNPNSLPQIISDPLTASGNEGLLDTVYIVGGTGSVSSSIENYLESVIK